MKPSPSRWRSFHHGCAGENTGPGHCTPRGGVPAFACHGQTQLADDLGFECIGAYGGKSYHTPNLDRLAREGDEFGGEPLPLGDVFSSKHEYPAVKAARQLDWEQFRSSLTDRCQAVLQTIAEGGQLKEVAAQFKISNSTIQNPLNQQACKIREFFGVDILKEISRPPQWRDSLLAHREMPACREERLPC